MSTSLHVPVPARRKAFYCIAYRRRVVPKRLRMVARYQKRVSLLAVMDCGTWSGRGLQEANNFTDAQRISRCDGRHLMAARQRRQ